MIQRHCLLVHGRTTTMTNTLNFRQVLSVLSKSSPYSVSTERPESISKSLDDIKDYLYIKTPIEADFYTELTSLSPNSGTIIFLCGSSGDGKSEILTKYRAKFSQRANFHLDATHSFNPHETAIQTLNKLFDEHHNIKKPLVIGINVGMLGNYAEEGENEIIKSSIKAFLNKQSRPANHVFLNFEDYPKFKLEPHGHTADFAKTLLQQITAKENNIIRQYYDKEKASQSRDKRLCVNYKLLSISSVQDVIIDVLFKARLMKDQFLTARALLDFVYHLLAGPKYLFDNLFTAGENELTTKIAEFDPANVRTQFTDRFVLSHSLNLPDDEFAEYRHSLKVFGLDMRTTTAPSSFLRLFYLLRNEDNVQFGNNYHKAYITEFAEQLIAQYSTIWHLHKGYDASPEQKKALKKFYNEVVIAAIHKYNNRNAVLLDKDHFFISKHNDFQLAAEIKLKVDFDRIKDDSAVDVSHFNAHLKVAESSAYLPININLLSLMLRIVTGYRPNKHDKNTVVLLDEVVEKIAGIANSASTLYILKDNKRYKINNVDDEDFEVSGL